MSRLIKRAFRAGVVLNAWLTRRPRLRWIEGRLLTPFFVRLTYWIRGRRAVAPSAEALGREWERLMPGRQTNRVTEVRAGTAYAEIHFPCPLRGSGDVDACHRLMAYDRGLMAAHGGRLVVLASQATPGRTHCELAIRPLADDASDLVPAHLLVRAR